MPRKRRSKGLDRGDVPLYCYTYTADGADYHVTTETWSGTVPVKDRRIMQTLETAPDFGLLWTNADLKEDS